jgi:hypothetical protein
MGLEQDFFDGMQALPRAVVRVPLATAQVGNERWSRPLIWTGYHGTANRCYRPRVDVDACRSACQV